MSAISSLEQLDLQFVDSHLLGGIASLTCLSSLTLSHVSGDSVHLSSISALRLETLQVINYAELVPCDLVNGLKECDRLGYVAVLNCPLMTLSSLAPLGARCSAVQGTLLTKYFFSLTKLSLIEFSLSLPHGDDPMHALDALQTLFPTALLSVYISDAGVAHQ